MLSASERLPGMPRVRRRTSIKGTRIRLPRPKRTALKVNGPTCSIPARWATKANPHIAAVNNNKAWDLSRLAFNYRTPVRPFRQCRRRHRPAHIVREYNRTDVACLSAII